MAAKIRVRPEDFRVEELTHVEPGRAGRFALYRLRKSGWTTHDALNVVRRRWSIDRQRLSYGGLKDRHAETSQHFTILNGPERDLNHSDIRVEHLGRAGEPFTSRHITANRFAIAIRDMRPVQAKAAEAAAGQISAGVPNYFDDQRFGSVGFDNQFVAKAMIREDYEAALKLALAAPGKHDRGPAKREKQILNDLWGDWPACKAQLAKGHARSIADYLVGHAGDYRGAVLRLKPELLSLYLSAYQSHIWNLTLAGWLRRHVPAESLRDIKLRMGPAPVPTVPWDNLTIPLPSARLPWDESAVWAEPLSEVLTAEGLGLSQIRLSGVRKPFFSRGERAAAVRPTAVTHAVADDDLYPRKRLLRLNFDLPAGCYATMVIKCVTPAS